MYTHFTACPHNPPCVGMHTHSCSLCDNPLLLVFCPDYTTKRVYINEVCPKGHEEIDLKSNGGSTTGTSPTDSGKGLWYQRVWGGWGQQQDANPTPQISILVAGVASMGYGRCLGMACGFGKLYQVTKTFISIITSIQLSSTSHFQLFIILFSAEYVSFQAP